MLSFVSRAVLVQGCALLAAAALAAAMWMKEDSLPQQPVLIACSISIAATALWVILPKLHRSWSALLLCANSGFWCGTLATLAPAQNVLLMLPLALLAIPGGWIVSRGYAIALKVLSGWLVAVALLSAALPLVTTPGYVPDHMD